MLDSIKIAPGSYEGYKIKVKNKLYRLLCEIEEQKNWEKTLDSLLIELISPPIDIQSINYEIFCRKISSLRFLNYKYFKDTIFECMEILNHL